MRTFGVVLIWIFSGVIILSMVFGLSLLLGYGNVFYTETVGAAQRDADRRVFENTRSYNQAKMQELSKYKAEYDMADDEGKQSLLAVIRHRYADYNDSELPHGLASFLRDVRGY